MNNNITTAKTIWNGIDIMGDVTTADNNSKGDLSNYFNDYRKVKATRKIVGKVVKG